MYGLPQAEKNTNYKLNMHLSKFGYEQSPITLGLWQHQTRQLQFSLVVDNLGLKLERQTDINHLLDVKKTTKSLKTGMAIYTVD